MQYGRKKIVINGDRRERGEWPGSVVIALTAVGAFLCALGIGYLLFPSPGVVAEDPPPAPVPTVGQAYEYVDGVIRKTATLGQLLAGLRVDGETRDRLLSEPQLRGKQEILAGSVYRIEYGDGEDRQARSLTVETDDSTLLRLQFLPYARLTVLQREISEREVHYAGLITKNFWLAILENDSLHHSLIPRIEQAMKWTVDLFHLGPGDRFKLIFRELIRDGQTMGVSRVDAIRIQTADRTYTVYGQPIGDSVVYLDYYGAGLQQRFLKAPVKFGIVSSPFSKARVHPVTGELKRHGGTDFAAPAGSPIYALANGKINRVGQDNFNGKYVAITHDKVHETMYLHMEDFVPELGIGKSVIQGQVIGYVGTTGQSTGPHVCLRFRRNGIEEDFLKHQDEKVFATSEVNILGFAERRDSLTEILERMQYEELIF